MKTLKRIVIVSLARLPLAAGSVVAGTKHG